MRFPTTIQALTVLATAALAGACDTPPQEVVSPDAPTAANRAANGAGEPTTLLRGSLSELNASGAAGDVTLRVSGDVLKVTLTARGLSAGVPHAQHIHIGGMNMCPRPESDFTGDDDFLTVLEGAPAYGGVRVSLTTEGDASAGSGLAVTRFPTADPQGVVTYRRDIDLAELGVDPNELSGGSVVVHGIASLFGDAGAYDGDARSSLNPDLPLEATIPALCGELSTPGSRGMGNGMGSASVR